MSKNDIIILESTLEQKRKEIASEMNPQTYFKIFCNEQSLKNYELTYEEILSGDTDGGDDGGIDSCFIFVNGDLVENDFEPNNIKKNPKIELIIVQCKEGKTFSETVFDKLNNTILDVFDFTKDLNSLRLIYNEDLINFMQLFRKVYLDLASKHPQLNIKYYYCSKGDTNEIHPKVKKKSETLTENTINLMTNAIVDVIFFGAKELIDSSRIEKSYTLQLNFIENYISKGNDNYIILTSLENYYIFVTDNNSSIRKYIFESNVRDYQGNVEVNKDIKNSLENEPDLDFWWLNNGITVLASKASATGKTIVLDNVQIVNGLQTTNEIYSYLNKKKIEEKDKQRSILVRIIVTDDTETRDKIIKATNFQTAISPASLKATDRIQRNIEDYFKHFGLYYDRRKNYYKNTGKPIEQIISIQYLAQAILSIFFRKPDVARSRPSSSIKQSHDYLQIFNEQIEPSIYLLCAQIMKKIDTFIKDAPYKKHIKNNLRFHLAMFATILLVNKNNYDEKDIMKIKIGYYENNLLQTAIMYLIVIAESYITKNASTFELVTKSHDFTQFVIEEIDKYKSKINILQPNLFQ